MSRWRSASKSIKTQKWRLPQARGVYVIYTSIGLYVGSARNLKTRMQTHQKQWMWNYEVLNIKFMLSRHRRDHRYRAQEEALTDKFRERRIPLIDHSGKVKEELPSRFKKVDPELMLSRLLSGGAFERSPKVEAASTDQSPEARRVAVELLSMIVAGERAAGKISQPEAHSHKSYFERMRQRLAEKRVLKENRG